MCRVQYLHLCEVRDDDPLQYQCSIWHVQQPTREYEAVVRSGLGDAETCDELEIDVYIYFPQQSFGHAQVSMPFQRGSIHA